MPVGAGFIPARIGENKKMTEHKKLQPEIRFAGFTDDWEQRKLGDVVNVLDNLRIPIAASQRLEGVTPYYGANGIQGYIDGFTHDGEFVLVAEDGANDLINYPVQYVSGKVWINNHAHVLQGIKNVANNLFLVYRIKSMDMTKYLVGGGRTKLNASVMKDIELHLPNYAEQTQIGNFFKQLDDTIALHQRTLEKYQKLKVSYLEKMFPKENERYPELRFPNFTDAWEQRKLNEISIKVIDKNVNNEFWETFTNSAELGVISQRDFFDKDISNSENINNYYIVKNNDFIYNPRISNFAPVGPIRRNKLGRTGVMSPLYYVFRTSGVDHRFLETFFETTKWHDYMKLNGDTGARADRLSIKDSLFEKMPIMFPSLEEQTQIGNFFKQLDDTIALHQKELAKYQQIKAACLEKMFVD